MALKLSNMISRHRLLGDSDYTKPWLLRLESDCLYNICIFVTDNETDKILSSFVILSLENI